MLGWTHPAEVTHYQRTFGFHAIFVGLQRVVSAGANKQAIAAEVLSASRKYRSILLEQSLQLAPDDDERIKLQQWEAIWHLAEVFLLELEDHIGPLFQSWVGLHSDLSSLASQITEFSDTWNGVTEPPPEYWSLVRRLLTIGQPLQALYLLEPYLNAHDRKIAASHAHPDDIADAQAAYENIRVLLRNKPMLATHDFSHFVRIFHQWKSDCDAALDFSCEIFRQQQTLELIDILKVMQGDENALLESSKTWQELLSGLAEFHLVAMRRAEFASLAVHCYKRVLNSPAEPTATIESLAADEDVTVLDKLCFHIISTSASPTPEIFSEKLWDLIVHFDEATMPAWFGAHFIDLLHYRQLLPSDGYADVVEGGIREHSIHNYCAHIWQYSKTAFWKVVLDYEAASPINGLAYACAFVEVMDFSNDEDALRVLAHLRHTYHPSPLLLHTMTGVHSAVAQKFLRQGLDAAALEHFVKAKDFDSVGSICKQRLKQALIEFGKVDIAVLQYSSDVSPTVFHFVEAVSNMVEDRRIEFAKHSAMEVIAALHEFWKAHEFIKLGKHSNAAALLLGLIQQEAQDKTLLPLIVMAHHPLLAVHRRDSGLWAAGHLVKLLHRLIQVEKAKALPSQHIQHLRWETTKQLTESMLGY